MLPGGIHTAGTSSRISDGASAVLLATEQSAARLGLAPLARVVDSLLVGVDPVLMLLGPHAAVPALLERNHLALDDIGVIEINEAFASVVLSFIDELKADPAVINPNGGPGPGTPWSPCAAAGGWGRPPCSNGSDRGRALIAD